MNKFKVGDKAILNRNFAGISKGKIFCVVEHLKDDEWLRETDQTVQFERINVKPFSNLFDLVEEKNLESETIVKKIPSWLKEEYYDQYFENIEIVTDFIKGHAMDHDISVTEGNETVLTATPRRQGN